jgi:hypothetical protein
MIRSFISSARAKASIKTNRGLATSGVENKAVTSFLMLAILIAGSFQSPAGRRVSDREQDGLLGPVKTIISEWSPVGGPRNGIHPGTRCPSQSSVYNEHGRLEQRSSFAGACGCEEIRDVYSYAQDGSQTEKTERIPAPGCPPPPPPMAAPPGSRPAGPPHRVFKYDDAGREVESSLLWPDGSLISKSVYEYDAKGRLTETTVFDGKGQMTYHNITVFNGESKTPASSTYFRPDGKKSSQITYSEYELNTQGDWVKRTETHVDSRGETQVSLKYRTIVYFAK